MAFPAKEKPKARELAYWYPFNVDQWYPQVEDLTFLSEFIHLSVEDAKDLIVVLEQNATSIEPTPYNEQRAASHPILAKVSSQIDVKLKKFKGGHAFVRLSSRSPKDAILGDVVDKHLDVETRRYLDEGKRPVVVNMHPLVYAACAKALEVTSGVEALHLLLNSFRVLEDLNYYTANPTVFPVCITLREWVDIPPSMEFRGCGGETRGVERSKDEEDVRWFVCENQFTAMTQYFHESYFEDLVQQKEEVEQQIIQFWEKSVKERLQYLGSYIVDFAIAQGRVWVLELNPFDSYTGTGLFSWEGHSQRLTKGPFKFALVESPLTHGNIWVNGKIRKSLDRVAPKT